MLRDIIKEEITKYIDDDFPIVAKRVSIETNTHINIREVQDYLNNNVRKHKFIDNMMKQFKIMEDRNKIYDLRHVAEIRKISSQMAKVYCMCAVKERGM